jgi:hypothetical protein
MQPVPIDGGRRKFAPYPDRKRPPKADRDQRTEGYDTRPQDLERATDYRDDIDIDIEPYVTPSDDELMGPQLPPDYEGNAEDHHPSPSMAVSHTTEMDNLRGEIRADSVSSTGDTRTRQKIYRVRPVANQHDVLMRDTGRTLLASRRSPETRESSSERVRKQSKNNNDDNDATGAQDAGPAPVSPTDDIAEDIHSFQVSPVVSPWSDGFDIDTTEDEEGIDPEAPAYTTSEPSWLFELPPPPPPVAPTKKYRDAARRLDDRMGVPTGRERPTDPRRRKRAKDGDADVATSSRHDLAQTFKPSSCVAAEVMQYAFQGWETPRNLRTALKRYRPFSEAVPRESQQIVAVALDGLEAMHGLVSGEPSTAIAPAVWAEHGLNAIVRLISSQSHAMSMNVDRGGKKRIREYSATSSKLHAGEWTASVDTNAVALDAIHFTNLGALVPRDLERLFRQDPTMAHAPPESQLLISIALDGYKSMHGIMRDVVQTVQTRNERDPSPPNRFPLFRSRRFTPGWFVQSFRELTGALPGRGNGVVSNPPRITGPHSAIPLVRIAPPDQNNPHNLTPPPANVVHEQHPIQRPSIIFAVNEDSDDETNTESDSGTDPNPMSDSKPEVEREREPKLASDADTGPSLSKPEAFPHHNPVGEWPPSTELKRKPNPVTVSESKTEPEPRPEREREHVPELRRTMVPNSRPELVPQSGSKREPDPKPSSVPKTTLVTETDREQEQVLKSESKREPKPGSVAESKTEIVREREPERTLNPEAASVPPSVPSELPPHVYPVSPLGPEFDLISETESNDDDPPPPLPPSRIAVVARHDERRYLGLRMRDVILPVRAPVLCHIHKPL